MWNRYKDGDLSINMKFGIVTPTNSPIVFKECVLSSLEHFVETVPYTKWLILFQEPWTLIGAKGAVRKIKSDGWDVEYRYTPAWEKPVRFIELRATCADMDDTCDAYFGIDADMRFTPGTATVKKSSGLRTLEAMDYMSMFDRCGAVEMRGFFGAKQWGQKIAPVWDWTYAHGVNGVLLRNMKDIDGWVYVPGSARELRGVCDEPVFSLTRIECGYFHSVLRNHTTYHKDYGHKVSFDQPEDSIFNKQVVMDNSWAWIRNRYGEPNYRHESGYKENPIDYKYYLSMGGPDFVNDVEIKHNLTVDYRRASDGS
jgi:hypothetical protein